MERREFLRGVCTCGLCSCAGMAVLGQGTAWADSEDSELEQLQQKYAFAQRRFAHLIELLSSNLEPEQRDKLLEELGRQCARESKDLFSKFKGNPQGFLDSIRGQWAERTEYDEDKGMVRVVGPKADACYCPLVQGGVTPVDFCNCSRGWQKEAFETMTGKAVEVRVEESVLRGGERCTFAIKIG